MGEKTSKVINYSINRLSMTNIHLKWVWQIKQVAHVPFMFNYRTPTCSLKFHFTFAASVKLDNITLKLKQTLSQNTSLITITEHESPKEAFWVLIHLEIHGNNSSTAHIAKLITSFWTFSILVLSSLRFSNPLNIYLALLEQ